MNKTLVILGSTGSIGEQALDVARKNGYTVLAIAAGKSIDKLEAQAMEVRVAHALKIQASRFYPV